MRFAFRVDASIEMGSGHFARCFSLGQALVDLGWSVVYVMRRLDAVAERLLADQPTQTVFWLDEPKATFSEPRRDAPAHYLWARVGAQQDAIETSQALKAFNPDWVIVDHYAFDGRWHSRVGSELRCAIGAIDDLGDRSLDVSFLVDPNWEADHTRKYAGYLAPDAEALLGPRFALLGKGYRQADHYKFSETVNSIGIFLGGTDAANYSLIALRACLEGVHFAGTIELMIRSTHPHLQLLESYCSRFPNVRIAVDQPNLASFFSRHDLQIGAGGGATWERCCIGVPSVLIAFADNQRRVVDAIVGLGVAAGVDTSDIAGITQAVRALINDAPRRERMALAGPALVDGWGCLRVASALSKERIALRLATQEDAEMAYSWRNAESTRRYFRDPESIDLSSHLQWWTRTLAQTDRYLLVGMVGTCNIGVVRLDQVRHDEVEVSLYLAPQLTGFGLGSWLLRATRIWVSSRLPQMRRIRADVYPANLKSARAFEAAGYSRVADRSWSIEV